VELEGRLATSEAALARLQHRVAVADADVDVARKETATLAADNELLQAERMRLIDSNEALRRETDDLNQSIRIRNSSTMSSQAHFTENMQGLKRRHMYIPLPTPPCLRM